MPTDPPHIFPIMKPVAQVQIATLDELLASHGAQVAKEAADKTALQKIVSIDSDSIRTSLFAWATAGFPNIYVIISIPLSKSQTCSDGIVRGMYEYVEWLTGAKIPALIAAIQLRLTDIEVSYSILDSAFRIHVTRTK